MREVHRKLFVGEGLRYALARTFRVKTFLCGSFPFKWNPPCFARSQVAGGRTFPRCRSRGPRASRHLSVPGVPAPELKVGPSGAQVRIRGRSQDRGSEPRLRLGLRAGLAGALGRSFGAQGRSLRGLGRGSEPGLRSGLRSGLRVGARGRRVRGSAPAGRSGREWKDERGGSLWNPAQNFSGSFDL